MDFDLQRWKLWPNLPELSAIMYTQCDCYNCKEHVTVFESGNRCTTSTNKTGGQAAKRFQFEMTLTNPVTPLCFQYDNLLHHTPKYNEL